MGKKEESQQAAQEVTSAPKTAPEAEAGQGDGGEAVRAAEGHPAEAVRAVTYISLQCLSHRPPLVAEGESGQHLYDLPQLREDIAQAVALGWAHHPDGIAALSVDCWPEERFRLFLREHPTCLLGIQAVLDREEQP